MAYSAGNRAVSVLPGRAKSPAKRLLSVLGKHIGRAHPRLSPVVVLRAKREIVKWARLEIVLRAWWEILKRARLEIVLRARLEMAIRHAAAAAAGGLRMRRCRLGVWGSFSVRGSLAADRCAAIVPGSTERRESRLEAGVLDGRPGLLRRGRPAMAAPSVPVGVLRKQEIECCKCTYCACAFLT